MTRWSSIGAEHIDVEAYGRGEDPKEEPSPDSKPKEENKLKEEQRPAKRRKNLDEGGSCIGGLTEAINKLRNTVDKAEAYKGIYRAVMDVPGFSRDQLMCALDHFMERKGAALVFMDMSESDRQLWLKRLLAKHYN